MLSDDGDLPSRCSYGTLLYRGSKTIPADRVNGRAIIETLTLSRKRQKRLIHPLANMVMGSIYAREDGNFEAARDMYEIASNAGVPAAKVTLARMYLDGDLPKDIPKARRYLEQAVAIQNNAEAHFLLAHLKMSQEKPDAAAAFQHYEKAASKGLPEAQYNLAVAYFRGVGVPKNESFAIEYWKMSAQQGFGLAQLSLGTYYFQDETPQVQRDPATGEIKVIKPECDPSKRDLMQAQMWFALASRRPGDLGLEGRRLKAQVDEAIRKSGDRSQDERACIIQ